MNRYNIALYISRMDGYDYINGWTLLGAISFQGQGKTEISLTQFFCSAPEVGQNITENPR